MVDPECETRFPGSCPHVVSTNNTASLNRVKIGITLGWNMLCLHCIDCSLTEDSPVCLQTLPLYFLVLSSSRVRDEFRMAEFQQFALANVLSLPGQTQHVVPNKTNSK